MKITQALIDRVRSAIPSGGAPLRKISEASGVHISNVRSVFKRLVDGGEAFSMRAGTGERSKHEVWMFRTEEARELFEERWLDEVSRRNKARLEAKAARRKAQREAEGRSLIAIAAERREARKRAQREEEKVRKELEAAALKSMQQKLKKETAAAGAKVFKAGTKAPAPKRSAWADMEPCNLHEIEIKVVECKLQNPYEPRPEDVPPLFSSLRPGQYIAPAPAWLAGIAA